MAIVDEAIERIKEMIVSGQLRPGDRLPKEADLANRLGLSRNSLREAVRALSLVRVLDVRQGDDTDIDGLIVTDLEFHRRIAVGSGNPVLASLIDSLSVPTVRARIWRGISQEGAAARTHEQHWAIFHAIRARQPEVARAWAAVHVAGVEEWLRQAV
jgi:DNA-binding FadR family transcriptional regulator